MRLVFIVLAIVVIGSPVAAAGAPSEARMQAATILLHTIEHQNEMAVGASSMADAMIQQNPMLGPYRDVILRWAASFITWKVFGPKYVALYADSFTTDELERAEAAASAHSR